MAKISIKTTTTKKRKKSSTPVIRRSKKSPDFNWTGWEDWSGAKFSSKRTEAIDYYYQNFKASDLTVHLYTWMKENKFSKKDIDHIKKIPQWHLHTHYCILAKCLLTGMPSVNERWNEYWLECPGTSDTPPKPTNEVLTEFVERLLKVDVEKKEEDLKEKKSNIPTINIQDRIKAQSLAVCCDLEEWLDGFTKDPKKFNIDDIDINKFLTEKSVSQAHARKIKDYFTNEYNEIKAVTNLPTAAKIAAVKNANEKENLLQLQEGYSAYNKTNIKKYASALEKIISGCEFIVEEKKATRKPRTKKPKSTEKLVSSIKYKIKDETYMIASINPSEIIGATELWVFNTKTRKLGKYIASNIDPTGSKREGSGLSIKGTTIQGFDTELSIQKTLRKPNDTLKEFKNSGKVKLRKFIDNIPTLETKLNGRINTDIILLKVQ